MPGCVTLFNQHTLLPRQSSSWIFNMEPGVTAASVTNCMASFSEALESTIRAITTLRVKPYSTFIANQDDETPTATEIDLDAKEADLKAALISQRYTLPDQVMLSVTVELQQQFLALRRVGVLPLQARLERRSLWSCALLTHRELSFVFNLGASLPPFYLIKSLCNCTSAAPMSSVPSVKRSTPTVTEYDGARGHDARRTP